MSKLKLLLFFGTLFLIVGCSDEAQDTFQEEEDSETLKRQAEIPNFNYLDACNAADIKIFVKDDCDETVFASAVSDAIQLYNEAPVGIGIQVINDESEADIVISCIDGVVCGQGTTIAGENGPGTEGTQIFLESTWENCPCDDEDFGGCNFVGSVPDCMFTRVAMHELGHALGIDHNDEGSHIVGTPDVDYDPNSVFNSGPIKRENCVWCDSPCEFNQNDLDALSILYPCACEPNLTGDLDICVGETITYCIDQLHDVDVQWTLPFSSTSNCITYTAPSVATSVLLSAVVEDNGCEYSFNEVINVHPEREVCTPPSQPPYEFSEICIGELEAICYDFGNMDCIEEIEIESSNPKLLVESEGSEVCLTYIWHQPTTITLNVTFINQCGGTEFTNWTINIVDCDGSDF